MLSRAITAYVRRMYYSVHNSINNNRPRANWSAKAFGTYLLSNLPVLQRYFSINNICSLDIRFNGTKGMQINEVSSGLFLHANTFYAVH